MIPKPVWDIPRRSRPRHAAAVPEAAGSWVYVIKVHRRPFIFRLARRLAIIVIAFCALTLLLGWQR